MFKIRVQEVKQITIVIHSRAGSWAKFKQIPRNETKSSILAPLRHSRHRHHIHEHGPTRLSAHLHPHPTEENAAGRSRSSLFLHGRSLYQSLGEDCFLHRGLELWRYVL